MQNRNKKEEKSLQKGLSAIISRMNWLKKSVVFLLILLPLIATAFLPLNAEALDMLSAGRTVESARQAGDRKAEFAALQQMSEYQPWRIDLFEQMADLQFTMGNYQQSLDLYQQAEKRGTLQAESTFNEGKDWESLGERDRAKNSYRQASEFANQSIDFYLGVAKAQEGLNDSIGILATLLRAYKLSPGDLNINYELGVQFAATQPKNALSFLENARTNPVYSTYAAALSEAITATDSWGESAERYVYLGQELSQISEWQAAASAFYKATRLDEQNAIAWALYGEAVQHVGEDGYPALSKALELDAQSDIVNGLMAIYYRRQQKYDLAIDSLYKAVENNPNESTWQIEIGNTLALQGDLADALIHLQVATLMEPDSWVPWQSLATFCINHNYYVREIGLEAARKALLLVPGSPVLLDIMGSVYYSLGDLDSSERFYLQAINAAPNQAEILYHLGELYLQKGDRGQAIHYLQQAAEKATDSRIRDNANLLIQQNGGN
jgi:superkiller protein 3